MLLRSTHFTTPRAKKPRKKLIPETLRAVYADGVAKAIELRRQGRTPTEVCDALNRLGYRTQVGGRLVRRGDVVSVEQDAPVFSWVNSLTWLMSFRG